MIEILNKAIEKYGVVSQLDMCIEECAELIQSINKAKRLGFVTDTNIIKPHKEHPNSLAYCNLCSEVADVKIMLEQMEIMLSKETIQISYERKLQRLEERINK